MISILRDFSRVASTEILAFIAHHSRMVVSFHGLSLPLGYLNATKMEVQSYIRLLFTNSVLPLRRLPGIIASQLILVHDMYEYRLPTSKKTFNSL